MGDRPVTIRTLDPPLHEFLPHTDEEIKEFSEKTGIPEEKIRRKIAELKEFNPMLGFRGCRLGIVYPEITAMQTRAIIEAACDAAKEGIKVKPEIMIPLVGHVNNLHNQVQSYGKTQSSRDHHRALHKFQSSSLVLPSDLFQLQFASILQFLLHQSSGMGPYRKFRSQDIYK